MDAAYKASIKGVVPSAVGSSVDAGSSLNSSDEF